MIKKILLAILIPFVVFTMAHAYVNTDDCYDRGYHDSKGFATVKRIECSRYERSASAFFAGIFSPIYWTIEALEKMK